MFRRESRTVKDLEEKGYHISTNDLNTMRRIYNSDPDRYVMRRARAKGRKRFYIALKGHGREAELELESDCAGSGGKP